MTIQEKIQNAKTYLGIEFGSTRIKAVLIDDTFAPIASGSHEWQNRYENGVWTYSLDDITTGLQHCYAALTEDIRQKFGVTPTTYGAIGISGMMHGYMAFDKDDNLLVPFRTWRNTITEQAASELSELLSFNIPQRWSIAHLYQAILNGEEHVRHIAHINTLAGYIHYRLTGKRQVGIGEASGIFPVDTTGYNTDYIKKVDEVLSAKGFSVKLTEVLPSVLNAGAKEAFLTADGAKLLDPTGTLQPGVPLCPPEGDAGTGMTATDSVLPRTGNVSAGTSIFAMLVLDKPLKGYYPEIDVVTTPCGAPVAMVHCNNCSSELDAWVKIFGEFAQLSGHPIAKPALYDMLYYHAMTGDPDCGNTVVYNFLSGEPVAGAENGRPMYFRTPDGKFNLANLFRAEIYSTMAALKLGMDILLKRSRFPLKNNRTRRSVQDKRSCTAVPCRRAGLCRFSYEDRRRGRCMGNGSACGIYCMRRRKSLSEFLDSEVFIGMESTTLQPEKNGAEGFARFMENYKRGLAAQYAAAK